MSAVGLIRLLRPYYAVPMSLAYALTVYYAVGGRVDERWGELGRSTLSLLCLIGAGYAFNEICDVAVDRARPKNHPLAGGAISLRAGWFATLALLAGSALSALGGVGGWAFPVALGAVGLTLGVYDVFSKRLGPAKPLLAAALMTSIYPLAFAFAGWPTGPRSASLMVFLVWLFMTSAGYELLKDIRDRDSDPAVGVWPGMIRDRPVFYRRLAGGLILGATPLLFLCGMFGCKWIFLAGATTAMALTIAAALAPLRWAIRLVYAECFLVAAAAAADVMILGV
jgi:4-hydroxybenzoate polyprenyltransferase